MAKGAAKKNSLRGSLDGKIENLIYRLLEEKALEKKRTNAAENDDDESMETVYFAKDLKGGEIFTYCQSKDVTMLRVKKVVLQKSIERVLKQVIEEESQEFESFPGYKDEEPTTQDVEAQLKEQNLMVTPEINDMNRSITEQWNIKAETPVEDTPDDKVNSSATKKRSKDSAPPKLKKQKTKEDRTPPQSKLGSIGGMEDVVAQLMELIGLPILHPEIYISTGVEPPRGVLLHGPPGCGKTSIANALAGELQVPFVSISAPSVVSGMSGESEKKIRDLFDEARSLAPCLMFFDEIDAITPKRDGGAQREMERRIVAQLLTSMDELNMEKTDGKPVIVIGATNRPDSLDSALRRAGRFDREICLNVPNEVSRIHILKKLAQNLKIDGEIDFIKLAKLTPGFVGADLKSLITAAGTCAIKRIFHAYVYSSAAIDGKMDVDQDLENKGESEKSLKNTANMIDPLPLTIIQRFLQNFPEPLNEEQLSGLSIKYEDFLKALPTIQPTAKREGFATVPDVTWASVGALTKVRVELNMAIVQPIKKPELYEKVGINAPAGVLLWGPPGCGKTLLAKAVANESRANFISIKGPELLNKYVGESERAIRQVFTRARASVPCVIFFDELDALVPRRDSTLSESSSRVVNTLLTELDGLNDRRGIFVVGATNRPDMIDPAMLRPGRLDKTLFIELPNADEKLDILRTLVRTNGTPLSSNVDLEAVIADERCKNFSGADIASLVRESSVLALKRSFFKNDQVQSVVENNLDKEFEDLSVTYPSEEILVTMLDFVTALKKVRPSVSDKDRLKYEKLSNKLGWNDDVELTTEETSIPNKDT
ncbi:ribosome bioproteinsis ATPase rix7 [Zygosaccharomyces mellis]|uniref:Ribosome bioproteinsis ATPase rix7 n=1 Tax=Zygosaccharomyces mellis TaxID=42258 RepID=A0A4C2EH88_9SACH|nr:ribosome bioproteinsis ATPase rix7 [Zygosaccharomyces mellis]